MISPVRHVESPRAPNRAISYKARFGRERYRRAMVVVPAGSSDLDAVMHLLSEARRWQRDRGFDVWTEFDPDRIAGDIAAGKVYIARIAAAIRATVTLADSDPLVWGADGGEALYVHKLASSRSSTGAGALLIEWARGEARRRGRKCIRLDTWNENPGMRAYYEKQGFRHVRDAFFPLDSPLPADYRGTFKSLYQLDL